MSDINTNTVHTGDAFEVLAELPADTVHAVVTDPPYAEGDYDGFMGRSWDSFDGPRAFQEWNQEWAELAKRVLKPGGHLLAFGSDDGHHRTACGIEDAGFEIRTHINWIYGSGFPKALDVSKAIDKAAGAEREVVGEYVAPDGNKRWGGRLEGEYESEDYGQYDGDATKQTAPATDAAEKWDGWKTALKPATEFVVLARAPLSEGTVAENVQTHGTGALNIDGCRIDHDGDDLDGGATDPDSAANFKGGWHRDWMDDEEHVEQFAEEMKGKVEHAEENGRYPANVVFDEQAAEQLDREVGELNSPKPYRDESEPIDDELKYGDSRETGVGGGYGDSGGPSRYFYTSKATKAERTLDGRIENAHPTVKPADLMEWLVTLVSAEGQTVLDPFAGTRTTGRAAKDTGREFVLIEQDAKWADVARVRCGLTPEDPSRVRDDDAQTGLEVFGE